MTTNISSTSSLRSSTVNDLTVPLNTFDTSITTDIVGKPGPPIKLGPLIHTLLCEAYTYWKLDSELITRTERYRYEPFTDILHVVELAPRFKTSRIPSNIGNAILEVVHKKLTLEDWRESFEIGVNKRFSMQYLRIASIYISKDTPSTTVGLAPSWKNDTILTAPGNGTNGMITEAGLLKANRLSTLPAVAISETDWLSCFSKMLFFPFSHDGKWPVTREIKLNLPYTFLSDNWRAKATLTIGPVPFPAFTFMHLAEGLLAILAEWATVDIWQSTEDGKIRFYGGLIATLTILPASRAGGLADGENVATA